MTTRHSSDTGVRQASPTALAARIVAAVGVSALLLAAGATGQEPPAADTPDARLTGVHVSADTVPLGDRFDVTLELSLPATVVAYVPDSIFGGGVEPFSTRSWAVEEGEGGTLRLSATYPLFAFEIGEIVVPEFEIFVASEAESRAAGHTAPGDRVGSWSGLTEGTEPLSSLRMLIVPARSVWVSSVLAVDDIDDTIEPRSPSDVVGEDRNWPATLMAFGFGALLLGISLQSARDWGTRDRRTGAEARVDPGAATLLALDQLLAEDLHRQGRTKEFYTRSSDLVRRYVEGHHRAWGPAHTATELMDALARAPAGEVEALSLEMRVAEAVKFGSNRPDPETAERFWHVLRAWVAAPRGTIDAPLVHDGNDKEATSPPRGLEDPDERVATSPPGAHEEDSEGPSVSPPRVDGEDSG